MKYLRPLEKNDIAFLMTFRNRPEYMKWFRQTQPLTLDSQLEWYSRINHGTEHHYIIHDPTSKLPMGYCCLKEDARHKSAEFSVWCLPGTNLGLWGLRELFILGFKQFSLNRIWSDVLQGNPALRLYKLLGFKEEGTLRQAYFKDNKFVDSTIIALLKEEYETSHSR